MKRILSLSLSVILLVSLVCSSVSAADLINLSCSYDTYSEKNDFQKENYDSSEVLLSGSVYSRRAEFNFDISSLENADYKGVVMSFWARNNFEDSKISFFDETGRLITALTLSTVGLVKCEIDLTDFVKKALSEQKKEIKIYADYEGSVITIFSSEYTLDKSMRPSLYTTDMVPYFPSQKSYEYPVVTQADLKSAMTPVIAGGHPYLFGNKDDFARIKDNAFGKDEALTKMYASVKALADGYIGKEPTKIKADISKASNFDRATECYNVISRCAFVYLVEGDEKYAERAWDEADFFASLTSWGTYQFIDNNQIAFGVALCYDWLYDWLGEEKRNKLVSSLNSNHLTEIEDLLKNRNASKYSSTYYQWYFNSNNHATLDNCFTFIQAMAIADVNLDTSTYIMAETLENLKKAFDKCYPDAAWYEGMSYWSNVGPRFADMFGCMYKSFGHMFGYENIPHVIDQSYFPIYSSSSLGGFIFNDSVPSAKNKNPVKYVYGILKGDKSLQKYSLDNDNFNSPFTLLFYDVNSDLNGSELELSKDKFFRNMDMVTMRSSWKSADELFCGMLVQDAGVTHGHMNSGTVTLDALGEKWITNPGRDSYSLAGYWENGQSGKRWQYYFGRAEANSCLVIAPQADGGQKVKPGDTIDQYVSKERGSYAIADLTETYAPYASEYKRGIMLGDDRTKFVIQDELSLKEEQEVYSFVNIYKCDAEILEDGKSIILSKNNKKVKVNILCDSEFELSVMNSKPLPTSPQVEGNMVIRTIKRIAVHFPKTKGFKLSMEFTPYLTEDELTPANDTITPLESWDIPDGEYIEMHADSIIADGVEPEGFNPYNRCYTVDELPQSLTATASDEYDISYQSSADGTSKYVILTHKESGRKLSYMLTTVKEQSGPNIIDVSGLKDLSIKRVSASEDDGNVPENTIDGKDDTRWSAQGEQHITFELGKASLLNCIAIKYYDGNKRSAYFDLQISNDGKTWETVSEYESCGTTNDFEYFSLENKNAAFVRYKGYGTSSGAWNSICEVKIYGK